MICYNSTCCEGERQKAHEMQHAEVSELADEQD